MSWESCMNGKIVNQWGPVVSQCASAGSSHDLQAIVNCIVGELTELNPATVLLDLTGWSVECAFEDKAEVPKP